MLLLFPSSDICDKRVETETGQEQSNKRDDSILFESEFSEHLKRPWNPCAETLFLVALIISWPKTFYPKPEGKPV